MCAPAPRPVDGGRRMLARRRRCLPPAGAFTNVAAGPGASRRIIAGWKSSPTTPSMASVSGEFEITAMGPAGSGPGGKIPALLEAAGLVVLHETVASASPAAASTCRSSSASAPVARAVRRRPRACSASTRKEVDVSVALPSPSGREPGARPRPAAAKPYEPVWRAMQAFHRCARPTTRRTNCGWSSTSPCSRSARPASGSTCCCRAIFRSCQSIAAARSPTTAPARSWRIRCSTCAGRHRRARIRAPHRAGDDRHAGRLEHRRRAQRRRPRRLRGRARSPRSACACAAAARSMAWRSTWRWTWSRFTASIPAVTRACSDPGARLGRPVAAWPRSKRRCWANSRASSAWRRLHAELHRPDSCRRHRTPPAA